MRRGRLLLYSIVLTAIVLIGLAASAVVFLHSLLPQTSGDLKLPVHERATVARNSLGMPHIVAASIEDAVFLQGYVTAQDRLFQLDLLRRLAAGELSEIVGPSAFELDREARQLRMRRIAEQNASTLTGAERALLTAYARGINAFISTHHGRGHLPVEFTLLGYEPKPWTEVDSILVAMQMFRDMTTSWPDDLHKRDFLTRGDAQKVQQLFPLRTGHEIQVGSNAWAISGRHTASGKPLLASDPHLQWSLPSAWYMVHLTAPGLNVEGVSLPGLPLVIIGHNDRIAWGCTNLHFDVQDLYTEQLNRETGQVKYGNTVEQARRETETILVKGRPSITIAKWVTRHGPVLPGEKTPVSLRWVAAEPGIFQFPILQMNQAQNWVQFTSALSRFPGPGQNFIYADVDGHIGYHAAGKLPIRRRYDGDIPADGGNGENEWDGYIPFDELPHAYDPPDGYLVTANQNPFPADYPYRVHGSFGPVYRAQQIRARLSSREGWQPEDLLAVQKDVYTNVGRQLAQETAAAWERHAAQYPQLQASVALLRNWDGQMDRDSAPALLASLHLAQLREQVTKQALHLQPLGAETAVSVPALEWVLHTKPAGWFNDYDALLLSTLQAAVDQGHRQFGPREGSWTFGRGTMLTIANPVLGRLPVIGRFFNIGPLPMSGSPLTVKQTNWRLGPSMRFVADLSNWEHSLLNITIGESGQPMSPHYRDQWEHYYTGTSFPLPFATQSSTSETLQIMP